MRSCEKYVLGLHHHGYSAVEFFLLTRSCSRGVTNCHNNKYVQFINYQFEFFKYCHQIKDDFRNQW